MRLQPGTLWAQLQRRTDHAKRSGALRPIDTEQAMVEDAGVRFLVRQVSSLSRKDADGKRLSTQAGAAANPFLPPEPDLVVTDISDSHFALLNKFYVIDHHLLIVTRRFEEQEALLNRADFEALFACLAEVDGLGFYNGGVAGGASQRHKHLQIVPLPLAAEGPAIPIAPLLAAAPGAAAAVPGLPFRHAFARLDAALVRQPSQAARAALECYRALMAGAGVQAIESGGELRQSAPYNLLVTREWMLLVPRSTESVEGVAVNALGYAGSLFVRDAAQMATIRKLGPMRVLQAVGVA